MKDIIWTLIVVWLIYRLTEIFRGPRRPANSRSKPEQNPGKVEGGETGRRSADTEGEYVDYEEIP